jgi:hypothetical protein
MILVESRIAAPAVFPLSQKGKPVERYLRLSGNEIET